MQLTRALKPDLARLAELSPQIGSNGYYIFTLDTDADDDAFVHGRMFAPAIGIDEDPVTGNANGPLGAYLVRHGLLQPHGNLARFRILADGQAEARFRRSKTLGKMHLRCSWANIAVAISVHAGQWARILRRRDTSVLVSNCLPVHDHENRRTQTSSWLRPSRSLIGLLGVPVS